MTQQASKSDKFWTGVRKITKKTEPMRWRALYRTMHAMDTDKKLDDIPALYQLTKLSLLQYQHGRRVKKTANLIMNNMIQTILENDDDLLILNYKLLTETQRYELIGRILSNMHVKISETVPDVAPRLVQIKHDTKYNKEKLKTNPKATPAMAYYNYHSKHIGICPELLNKDDFLTVAGVLAHEYVHVLQSVYKSSLPTPIIKFMHRHRKPLFKMGHNARPNEKEANRIKDLVKRRFPKRYETLSDAYYSERD